ncbi:MAG TPA: ABC transporter substrate-binding protein [Rugosibacter sp.]
MKSIAAFISSVLIVTSVLANDMAPDVLIKSVSSEVLEIVRADKDIQSGDAKKAMDLVEKKIAPNFDFLHMTRLALGRDWRQASAEQQKALANEFQILLVRTYSRALTEYKNQTIDIKPLLLKTGETDAKVHSEIKQPGAQSIQLDYYLQKGNAGWKIYDIEIAGISLVTNYRDSFAREVRNSGIDGLIKSLQTKNRSGDTVAIKK